MNRQIIYFLIFLSVFFSVVAHIHISQATSEFVNRDPASVSHGLSE